MSKNSNNLIWIDLEMTGLDPNYDSIIEIATVVTDGNLNVIEAGPVMAIHQSDEVLAIMDEWNRQFTKVMKYWQSWMSGISNIMELQV